MAAALYASLEGLDVLLCEKSDQVGGTGATSAGTLWIPGNTQNKDAGFDDSAAQADLYLSGLIGAATLYDMRAAYLADGPAAIDYLSEHTDVRFLPCGVHPDYRSNIAGAAIAGRAIVPVPFDGRLLGDDFKRIRAPIPEFMLFGGMMVGKADLAPLIGRFRSIGNLLYATRLFTRYLVDRMRYPRGTRLMMGNALIARLFYSLRKRNVPILFNAPVAGLLGDKSGVSGARLAVDGREIAVKSRRGVVLATGGYARNEDFRRTFMPQPVPSYSLSYEGNRGDGVAIGQTFGAAVTPDRGDSGLWAPVSVVPRPDGSKGLFPHLVLDRAKPGLIAVNSAGRRFTNEAASYHDFVVAMFETNKVVPAIPAYLVCDAAFLKKYGLGIVYPRHRHPERFVESGYLKRGATLDELAAAIGVDAAALQATVARHNEFARTGVDVDFGKGETALNRFNGDLQHKPNHCIGSLATAPFYALPVWPADLAVSTGLATDADARVRSANGEPITGLYACGNDMASVMGGSYPGPGTTLGPAVVFAYRAARHAARVL
jgi:succinate dehydrogenase/fumarate reductase flavoprotein subunit